MSKKIFLSLLIINCLFPFNQALASSPADLVFTEIMYDPDGSDSDREWVEIYNKGNESITIITGNGENSWRFNDGSNHLLSLFQGSEVIGSNQWAILAADGQTFLNEHPGFTGNIFDTTMNLNNSSETIKLSADMGQSFFGAVAYDASWGAAGNGKTLEKIDYFGGETQENWQESYIMGGTPGQNSSLEPPNQPPVAIAGEDQIINFGTVVLFDGTGSVDPDNDQLSYLWDFGDNQTGEGATTAHTYNVTGTFSAILTVSDGEFSDQDDLNITVNGLVNQPPVAVAGPDLSGYINQPVYFSASGSVDPDNDPLTYNWDFGDNQTASGIYINHSYQVGGNYTATLTVSDGQFSATDTVLVIISNQNSGQGGSSIDYSLIFINELLPNPAGSDDAEWLELYNDGEMAIDLNGTRIQDNSAAVYQITSEDFLSTIINAKSYFIIERAVSGIALNNTGGDCLKLSSPANIIIKNICYSDQALEAQSFARKSDNSWSWTEIVTKNNQNQFPVSFSNNLSVNEDEMGNAAIEYFDLPEFNAVVISEFLPNPIGSDNGEYIELYNQSTSTINLINWSLDDQSGGSAPFKVNEDKYLGPMTYIIFEKVETKLSLNNTNDQVRLILPTGQIVQQVDYQSPPEGQSYNYNLFDDEWYWSAISPGLTNLSEQAEALVSEAEDIENIINSRGVLTISQAKQLAVGDLALVSGVVIARPGDLGDNIFYLAEIDDRTKEIDYLVGLQVYNYKKDFPDLRIGDWIEVSGEISESQGAKRLKIKNQQAINIFENINLPLPPEIEIGEVTDALSGGLITVTGEIIEKKSHTITLSDTENELAVYIKDKNLIDFSQLKSGYQLKATGIVSKTKNSYRLLPRTKDDLSIGTIISPETMGQEKAADIKSETITTASNHKVRNALVTGLGGLTIGGVALFIKSKFIN